MKNQAKWAGQIRHFMDKFGMVLLAFGVATQVEATALANYVDATFGAVVGLVGVVIAIWTNVASWLDPAKNVGEGD